MTTKGHPRTTPRTRVDLQANDREQLAHFEAGDRVRLRKAVAYARPVTIPKGALGTIGQTPWDGPVPGFVPVLFDGDTGEARLCPTRLLDYLEPSSPGGPARQTRHAPDPPGGDGRRAPSSKRQ